MGSLLVALPSQPRAGPAGQEVLFRIEACSHQQADLAQSSIARFIQEQGPQVCTNSCKKEVWQQRCASKDGGQQGLQLKAIPVSAEHMEKNDVHSYCQQHDQVLLSKAGPTGKRLAFVPLHEDGAGFCVHEFDEEDFNSDFTRVRRPGGKRSVSVRLHAIGSTATQAAPKRRTQGTATGSGSQPVVASSSSAAGTGPTAMQGGGGVQGDSPPGADKQALVHQDAQEALLSGSEMQVLPEARTVQDTVGGQDNTHNSDTGLAAHIDQGHQEAAEEEAGKGQGQQVISDPMTALVNAPHDGSSDRLPTLAVMMKVVGGARRGWRFFKNTAEAAWRVLEVPACIVMANIRRRLRRRMAQGAATCQSPLRRTALKRGAAGTPQYASSRSPSRTMNSKKARTSNPQDLATRASFTSGPNVDAVTQASQPGNAQAQGEGSKAAAAEGAPAAPRQTWSAYVRDPLRLKSMDGTSQQVHPADSNMQPLMPALSQRGDAVAASQQGPALTASQRITEQGHQHAGALPAVRTSAKPLFASSPVGLTQRLHEASRAVQSQLPAAPAQPVGQRLIRGLGNMAGQAPRPPATSLFPGDQHGATGAGTMRPPLRASAVPPTAVPSAAHEQRRDPARAPPQMQYPMRGNFRCGPDYRLRTTPKAPPAAAADAQQAPTQDVTEAGPAAPSDALPSVPRPDDVGAATYSASTAGAAAHSNVAIPGGVLLPQQHKSAVEAPSTAAPSGPHAAGQSLPMPASSGAVSSMPAQVPTSTAAPPPVVNVRTTQCLSNARLAVLPAPAPTDAAEPINSTLSLTRQALQHGLVASTGSAATGQNVSAAADILQRQPAAETSPNGGPQPVPQHAPPAPACQVPAEPQGCPASGSAPPNIQDTVAAGALASSSATVMPDTHLAGVASTSAAAAAAAALAPVSAAVVPLAPWYRAASLAEADALDLEMEDTAAPAVNLPEADALDVDMEDAVVDNVEHAVAVDAPAAAPPRPNMQYGALLRHQHQQLQMRRRRQKRQRQQLQWRRKRQLVLKRWRLARWRPVMQTQAAGAAAVPVPANNAAEALHGLPAASTLPPNHIPAQGVVPAPPPMSPPGVVPAGPAPVPLRGSQPEQVLPRGLPTLQYGALVRYHHQQLQRRRWRIKWQHQQLQWHLQRQLLLKKWRLARGQAAVQPEAAGPAAASVPEDNAAEEFQWLPAASTPPGHYIRPQPLGANESPPPVYPRGVTPGPAPVLAVGTDQEQRAMVEPYMRTVQLPQYATLVAMLVEREGEPRRMYFAVWQNADALAGSEYLEMCRFQPLKVQGDRLVHYKSGELRAGKGFAELCAISDDGWGARCYMALPYKGWPAFHSNVAQVVTLPPRPADPEQP